MKLALFISAVLLFVFGFGICSFVYPDYSSNPSELNKWWDLRMNLYSILILICFAGASFNTSTKLERFILAVGIGMSASDVLDRMYFDITTFTMEDIAMVAITVFVSWLEIYSNKNINTFIQKLCQRLTKK